MTLRDLLEKLSELGIDLRHVEPDDGQSPLDKDVFFEDRPVGDDANLMPIRDVEIDEDGDIVFLEVSR